MIETKFENLSISKELQMGIADSGYTTPTDIQAKTIPLLLEKKDVIGQSQTGSGKTAAYALPCIQNINFDDDKRKTQALILCPTRELADQVTKEIKRFSKYIQDLNTVSLFGGESLERQRDALKKGCQIVVGTPGRVMDHMRRRNLNLKNVKTFVLDEADEMLDMGFLDDIRLIATDLCKPCQTVLFSATLSKEILQISREFQNNPEVIKVQSDTLTVNTVSQSYYEVPKGRKTDAIYALVEYFSPEISLVFCNTKKGVDELSESLNKRGISSYALHGDMRQSQRTEVMNGFKAGKIRVLVATDVAARGIDVNNIEIVFNYDVPQENEYYIHRIGRTARAGKSGKAISLIEGRSQYMKLLNIMRYSKCKISKEILPKGEEIFKKTIGRESDKLLKILENQEYRQYIEMLDTKAFEKFSAIEIAAAIITKKLKNKVKFCDFDIGNPMEESACEAIEGRRIRTSRPRNEVKTEYNDENMVPIRLAVGKKNGVMPGHIVGAIAGESGISGKEIGNIAIHKAYSLVDVPKEHKEMIIKKLKNVRIKGSLLIEN